MQLCFLKKEVKGHIYYDLVQSRRQGGRVTHERMIYLGKLTGTSREQRELLAKRIESLLSHQYMMACNQVHQRIGRLRARHGRVSKAFHVQTADDGHNVLSLEWQYDAALEKRNGTYVIRTSMPIESPQQAWSADHALANIEAVNRCCKTDLNMRPVYHQKDCTVKAHLFLTLLACTIVQYIRHQLAAKGIRHSWKEIVRIMNTQKTVLAQFSNEDKELFLLSQWSAPEDNARQIYDALGYDYQPYGGFFFKINGPDP